MNAYAQAQAPAFSSSNILSAFSGTGLFPFYPAKVLHHIPKIETQAVSSNESDNNEPLSIDPSLIPSQGCKQDETRIVTSCLVLFDLCLSRLITSIPK